MITIVDYDAGNAGSVVNICRKAGGEAQVSRDPDAISTAGKLILPGVGHFGRAMERLTSSGIAAALEEAVVRRKAPILGICLGMQLLTTHSEEGDVQGLGFIAARTTHFRPGPGSDLKVPHMGWNAVEIAQADVLTERMPEAPRFYFVHSYFVTCEREEDVLMRTTHGVRFVSALHRDNIRGTQFHPEKSHKFGLALIRNFVERISPC
ncbi:MAG: imidazole glycerol phosphate synthase subunit HisH [Rhodomicrobium sp.]